MPEERQWTEQQKKVIDLQDRSMLVSAAAGSGKTAVLVERIIRKILLHRVNIDELLVVTFTKAAAAEMRERIAKAIGAELEQNPEDEHLLKQSTLLHQASITTIDSFCQSIVRSHFHEIDLDPGFRIADEGELQLLKEDTLDNVLNDFYEQKDPLFLRFIDNYSNPKNDDAIRQMVLKLYEYAQSYPWPEEWLDHCPEEYEADNEEELANKPWIIALLAYLQSRAQAMESVCMELLRLCADPDGPTYYSEAVEADLSCVRALLHCQSLSQWQETLADYQPVALSRKKNKNQSEDKKTLVQNTRNKQVKEVLQGLYQDYFEAPIDLQLSYLSGTGQMVAMLVEVTKAFSSQFEADKAKKNILSFQDVEHKALSILVDHETGETTPAAKEYRSKFSEVMIDEYQDSNYLQEEILKAVSRLPEGGQNMFMVGDVKQSIYRFRLARPELFMDKFHSFSLEESQTQRIDLYHNFRSSTEVIQTVNDTFSHIMAMDLGNIEYDDAAALHGPESQGHTATETYGAECILVTEQIGTEDKKASEATAVAARIRKLVENQEIPGIGYRDIAILSRSLSGWSESFQTVFEREGIPLIVASKSGYFTTVEVQTILALLKVLDNNRQDLPLAAVLRSMIGGCTDEELALIRGCFPKLPFYKAAKELGDLSREELPSDEFFRVWEKLKVFWAMEEDLRSCIHDLSTHELLQLIYDRTGYLNYVTAMPGGKQRRANLDMLLQKAIDYEKTSYSGLYHFIRYVDRLIKYNVDFGEAEVTGEKEDAVRFMTIHKSKGLEFPVVFVVGMGKQFNEMDLRSNIVFHSDYGAGLTYRDSVRRVKAETLIHRAFILAERKENLGEELRVLYVAMTRAKWKLIMTGFYDPEKNPAYPSLEEGEKLPFSQRFHAKNYWDWVLPALLGCGHSYPVFLWNNETCQYETVAKRLTLSEQRDRFENELIEVDPERLAQIDRAFSWSYPYEQEVSVKQKISVSELKHRAAAESAEALEEHTEYKWFEEEPPVPYLPKFVQQKEENVGALAGSAMHRFMQCYEFDGNTDAKELSLQFLQNGLMTEQECELLSISKLENFLRMPIAGRMADACKDGKLLKEKAFVMSVPAYRAWEDTDSREEVLIQGIIDAFWQEKDGLVLLDYKTDRVKAPEELIQRYETQLLLYKEALERSNLELPVKEVWIYSFHLNQLIPVV